MCCAVLCCAVLYYAVLCCIVLYYAVLCYSNVTLKSFRVFFLTESYQKLNSESHDLFIARATNNNN